MIEVLLEAINNANILPTALLTFTMVYWLIVLIGLADMDSFDLDVDTDVDVDVDVDAGADVESDVSGTETVSWLNGVLMFFNLQYLPLMVFLTFWFLPTWLITLSLNHAFGNETFLFSLAFFIPSLIGSLFVAKVLTHPLAKLFKKMDNEREVTNPIGKVAEVRLPANSQRMGQAIIKDLNGNVVQVNILTQNDFSVEKGSQVLIIQYVKKERAFLVEPYQ